MYSHSKMPHLKLVGYAYSIQSFIFSNKWYYLYLLDFLSHSGGL